TGYIFRRIGFFNSEHSARKKHRNIKKYNVYSKIVMAKNHLQALCLGDRVPAASWRLNLTTKRYSG
ncbi:MAG: hypothetical protein WBN48_19175, partial [Thiogranum sp.]